MIYKFNIGVLLNEVIHNDLLNEIYSLYKIHTILSCVLVHEFLKYVRPILFDFKFVSSGGDLSNDTHCFRKTGIAHLGIYASQGLSQFFVCRVNHKFYGSINIVVLLNDTHCFQKADVYFHVLVHEYL